MQGWEAIGWPWSCDLRAGSHRKEADQTGSMLIYEKKICDTQGDPVPVALPLGMDYV